MAMRFNLIPNLLLAPGVYMEIDNSRAVQGLPNLPNRVILIGGMLDTGTADAGVMKQIVRKNDGHTYFGSGSQLGRMAERFKNASRWTEVWAIGVADDDAAVAATKTLTVTGTATSAGTLHLLVHGERVPVNVALGDDADAIATKIAAKLGTNQRLLYTAAVDGTTTNMVVLTSKHGGAWTNDLDVRLNYFDREELDAPGGVTVAIAAGAVGTIDPDITATLALIGGERFATYVSAFSDDGNVDALETELERRWGPTVMQDAVGFHAVNGTYADLTTAADARNSQFSILCGLGQSPTPEFEIATVVAAVSSNEPDPGAPRQTLVLPGVLPPPREQRFELEERELLLQAGVATFTVNNHGDVAIERLVTTYTEDADGNPDTSFQDLEIMLLIAATRYTSRHRIQTKYPRSKLGDDNANYGPGQKVVTLSVLRAELIGLAEEWEASAWIESADTFAEQLTLERNETDRSRVDAILPPDFINQFRVFAGQIQFQI